MPKIHGLPPKIGLPDGDDVLAMDDASVADPTSPDKTKRISLTQLKEWLQSLVGWITTAMIADSQINASKVDWAAATGKIWYEEIGRTDLASPASSISVTFAARKNLKILFRPTGFTGNAAVTMRFNNISSAQYSWARVSSSSASAPPADTASASDSSISLVASTSAPGFYTMDIRNAATHEKMGIGSFIRSALGAGSSIVRDHVAFKWVNAAQITRVDIILSANNMEAGSEIVVLGHD